jgi:DNA-binding response OmpR family regulator
LSASDKPRVLVVDDERVLAETLVMVLNHSGFETRAAFTGDEARRIALEFSPQILISDVLLADQDGIELAMEISRLLPQTRVLLFTGQHFVEELLRAPRAQGFNFEILSKPVHPKELVDKLRTPASTA